MKAPYFTELAKEKASPEGRDCPWESGEMYCVGRQQADHTTGKSAMWKNPACHKSPAWSGEKVNEKDVTRLQSSSAPDKQAASKKQVDVVHTLYNISDCQK